MHSEHFCALEVCKRRGTEVNTKFSDVQIQNEDCKKKTKKQKKQKKKKQKKKNQKKAEF